MQTHPAQPICDVQSAAFVQVDFRLVEPLAESPATPAPDVSRVA